MNDSTRILFRLTADYTHTALRAVSSAFRVMPDEIRGTAQQVQIVAARQAFYRLLYETTTATLHEVGAVVERDHTTVLHGVQQSRRWPESKPAYANAYRVALEAVTR